MKFIPTIRRQKFKKVFLTKIPPQKEDKIINLDNIDINDYELLVLPGGVKSMEILRLDKKAIRVVQNFNDSKKIISAICSEL